MSELQSYFGGAKVGLSDHPLLRHLAEGKLRGEVARVSVHRPRAALGFEPATLSLNFYDSSGTLLHRHEELWDADLNQALIDDGVCAADTEDEATRFGLALATAFEPAESRFGDGFFNSVLMTVINESPLALREPIEKLLPHVFVTQPLTNGRGLDDCKRMVEGSLRDRMYELREQLKYPENEADEIFVAAVANFLDERFTITDRRKFNWL